MEFIETKAVESNNKQPLFVSNGEEEKITDELDDFIDNSEQPGDDVSFYRLLYPLNIDHYPKLPDQTRNLLHAIFEDDTLYYGKEDIQPELYAPEDRDFVSFIKFASFENYVEKFKKTLKNFEDSENQFLTPYFMVLCFINLTVK